jgi:DNA repair protein RadC
MPKPAAFAEALLPFDEADISAASIGTGARLPSYITDHRRRLRERFMAGGAAALPDYEMLELVLFRAIPRQDVKPLARRLIDRFVDFNGVISASPARLAETEGVGDAVICELKIIDAAAGDFKLGCAGRLLPYDHGPPRDLAFPRPLPR